MDAKIIDSSVVLDILQKSVVVMPTGTIPISRPHLMLVGVAIRFLAWWHSIMPSLRHHSESDLSRRTIIQ